MSEEIIALRARLDALESKEHEGPTKRRNQLNRLNRRCETVTFLNHRPTLSGAD